MAFAIEEDVPITSSGVADIWTEVLNGDAFSLAKPRFSACAAAASHKESFATLESFWHFDYPFPRFRGADTVVEPKVRFELTT